MRFGYLSGSVLAAVTVAVTGPIGFIGLVVPHLVRARVTADGRVLMPCAFFLGGVLLASCDALGRVVLAPAEVPAGAITACVGGPYLDLARRGGARNAGASRCSSAAPRRTPARAGWRRRSARGCGGAGVAVAPFKAQNMSNNSYPCRQGGEIGRAQVVQAEACGLEPEPAMNPILLKPNGAGSSQVVVNGRVWKTLPPRGYYEHADELRRHVLAAYDDLARRFDVIVIEGAGSVSELNLRSDGSREPRISSSRLRAPWMLVADIERGGVFASDPRHDRPADAGGARRCFRGFAINKFRGDVSLFEEGARDARGADRVALLRHLSVRRRHHDRRGRQPRAPDRRRERRRRAGARIAIVRLPCLSNATDFRLLTWADWIQSPPAGDYDFVVLPGTKNSIARSQVAACVRPLGVDSRRSAAAAPRSSASAAGFR